MKLLLAIFALALAISHGVSQTIKTLGYNSTNGQVAANTGTNTLRFTNAVSFDGGPFINSSGVFYGSASGGGLNLEEQAFIDQGDSNLFDWGNGSSVMWHKPFEFYNNQSAQTTRTNLGLGATWLTNTNVTNFRTAIGLGTGSDVTFSNVSANNDMFIANLAGNGDYAPVGVMDNGAITYVDPSTYRANLGLPLAALTNTSNVTMMRALAGSTNTNHPYSGSISVVGTNNTNTLVFSNGILVEVQ